MTQRLAVACARHPWRTVAAWIGAIVVAVVLVGALLGDNLSSEGHVTNDPESLRAYDLQSERFPQQVTQTKDRRERGLVVHQGDELRVGRTPSGPPEPFSAGPRAAFPCSHAGWG